jgi:hypothetical protein
MTTAELVATLTSKGIALTVNGDKLHCKGKGLPLTPELRAILKGRKGEIIALLSSSECTKSPFQPDALTDHLVGRLQAGSQWLTAQHEAWLEGNPDAARDERFSVALAAWGEMERSLRLVFSYGVCVFGPDRRCPVNSRVTCDFCANDRGGDWL